MILIVLGSAISEMFPFKAVILSHVEKQTTVYAEYVGQMHN